jgi:hypothetical protein
MLEIQNNEQSIYKTAWHAQYARPNSKIGKNTPYVAPLGHIMQPNTNIIVFGLTCPFFVHTIYGIGGKHAIQYTCLTFFDLRLTIKITREDAITSPSSLHIVLFNFPPYRLYGFFQIIPVAMICHINYPSGTSMYIQL